ncbi:Lnb N-terminal periplasmic domain-containing protein [Methylomonas sp. 11b]|uniref:Lnb N-terminal periplasmic domain-containing protein n=1 Tax=Methylomonas sp. 11b TaxID=1168169 RepID=UPI00055AAE72|nr:DUF4105 domain-containing protein [Methylomonas sp. 11b]
MRWIKASASVLILLITILWGVCALYFGDSATGWPQRVLAALFALLGVATLISLAFARWRKYGLIAYGTVFGLVLLYWLSIAPSNQRHWQADAEKLAYATFEGDSVTVHDIRNFDYRSEFDYRPAYYTKTFDLNKLQGVDLFSVYWMGPAIAHTILSFDFGGNDHLAISIEARKEQGEGYSTIKGFFRQYELIYFVADERDVIRLRTNYRNNPPEQVYLYKLQGPIENAKRLFLEYLRKINELNEKPAFYNTLLDNCTTAIWMRTLANRDHLSFSWKILLSGYVPEYLYEAQRLDTGLPFSELQRQALINPLAQTADQAVDFSMRIRSKSNH